MIHTDPDKLLAVEAQKIFWICTQTETGQHLSHVYPITHPGRQVMPIIAAGTGKGIIFLEETLVTPIAWTKNPLNLLRGDTLIVTWGLS